MNGPVEGVTLICKVIQGSRDLLCCCYHQLTLRVCVVKAGLLLLWYSLREEQGIEEHIPGILRPGPGSGAHHFLFTSAGENTVIGHIQPQGRLNIWLRHYYCDLTTDKRPGHQGPRVSSWTRTKTSCCLFPWGLISEIAGGILVFGSPLFTSEILTSKQWLAMKCLPLCSSLRPLHLWFYFWSLRQTGLVHFASGLKSRYYLPLNYAG